jgi:purine-binding chemotaxis protein CheW
MSDATPAAAIRNPAGTAAGTMRTPPSASASVPSSAPASGSAPSGAPASASDGNAGRADFRVLLEREGSAQVVAFHLGGELHGCDIRLVEEVVVKREVHPLPDMPAHLLGVLLLRGEMVPVMDVAPALGLALRSRAAPSILVVGMGEGRIGVAAEAVHEVLEVPADTLRPAPYTGGDRDAYVVAVARLAPGLVNLIDLAEILRERTTLDSGEQP